MNGTVERVEEEAHTILACARRVDGAATICGVTRSSAGMVVKVAPSADAGTAIAIGMLAAVRMSFPYASAALIEDAVSGSTVLQVVLHSQKEEFNEALTQLRSTRIPRLLNATSNALLALSACSFGCLLYVSLISPT